MSFITKRDRVFNDYDLFDLPARNEGKLKAYASCTDARAWSHFCSDKSEHLVEIIKRNNETCRPKYVPTDAIVNTLMAAKNAEIGRLKHKIEEFEQMIAAYDQLELTCEQKSDIENAHAAIRAANKELNDLYLDLDLSGFTEGVDSEVFETGKSRGDEISTQRTHEISKAKAHEWEFDKDQTPMTETKGNQTGPVQPHDASTSVHDPRIDDLQDVIISKDAKLSAMQNTLAVMENDICEPYCIYAHIYTALEKIFGTLCQNRKYKDYLDLLTAGKDTRGIDVKGKILFKLKVLEKFSLALIAPCSQDVPNQPQMECSCYHSQVETTFALTSPITKNLNLDSKRALLVADIMDNQEIKEILRRDSPTNEFEMNDDQIEESFGIDSYSIETENITRLKNLQANYEDLLNCYENLKYEKNCLLIKCKKYDELEKELDSLRGRLQEYNLLWNEKEHYRKRSEDLDTLKEKFFVLSEETLNIETKLKAETEINSMKSKAMDELRYSNISLDSKLNDMAISFEKEKNVLICKLKEYECKIMCQDQQIKSLSIQIDQLLEQDRIPSPMDSTKTLELSDQIESLKQQVQNLQNALFCDEEEKLQLQEEFERKLELINDLRMEIEDWKSNYDKVLQSQNYLEKYSKELEEENKVLSKEIENRSGDINNFISIVNNKSQENEKLLEELERRKNENKDLCMQLKNMTENFDKNIFSLENEKKRALFSLQLARTDSQKLIKGYEEPQYTNQFETDEVSNRNDLEDNERCLMNIVDCDNENSILLQEIQKFRADNITNIGKLQDENTYNKKSLEQLKKESIVLKHKLENLSQQFQSSHDRLIEDKIRLENELHHKTVELNNMKLITKRESETLIGRLKQSENVQEQLSFNYDEVVRDNRSLLSDLSNKEGQLKVLSESLNALQNENDRLRQEASRVYNLEQELRNLNDAYETLTKEVDRKSREIDNLYIDLENKIEDNSNLQNQIIQLQHNDISSKKSIINLQNEKSSIQTNLDTLKKESVELINKLNYYETLENNFNDLKIAYDQVKLENHNLQKAVEKQAINLKNLQNENSDLIMNSHNLLTHNQQLEETIINTRNELLLHLENPQELLTITKEIENMQQEKNMNHQKIKKLLDKLDESECIISRLTEDVLARNDKITVLENHINNLQDEIRNLHSTLDNLTETSEQIKDYSLQNIDQCLKRVEAHHSKATHNMRIELAQLQTKNNLLENQLSETKLTNEESMHNIRSYESQNTRLQNDIEAIATDLKLLEIKSIGNSTLSPNNCSVEDILATINKITKNFETTLVKNTSLEKTLLKVQSSFQLVVNKADEEKKLIDTEMQKLRNEKEDTILTLQNMEKTLIDQKEKYELQIARDKNIINDLEAEICNQNLIINKINKSQEEIIFKLEEEIKSLQQMYEMSLLKVAELQDMINKENNKNLVIINETNASLKEKCKEIKDLKDIVQGLKNKSVQSVAIQSHIVPQDHTACSTQTNNDIFKEKSMSLATTLKTKEKLIDEDNNLTNINNGNIITDILPKNEPYLQNTVQILRANVPTFFDNRNDYIGYKMKRLNFGPMEKCSISSLNDVLDFSDKPLFVNENREIEPPLKEPYTRNNPENFNSIDVYNVQPVFISPSQKNNRNSKETEKSNSLSSSSLYNFNKTGYKYKTISKDSIGVKKHKSDNDLFIIYKDSSNDNESPISYEHFIDSNGFLAQHVENTNKIEMSTVQIRKKKQSKTKNEYQTKENINDKCDNKIKLKVDLPRMETASSNLINNSDSVNKSLDSYSYALHSASKKNIYSENNQISPNSPLLGSPITEDKLYQVQIHDIFFHDRLKDRSETGSNKINETEINSEHSDTVNKAKNTQLLQNDSCHNMSRGGANVLLLEYSDYKSTNNTISSQLTNDSQNTPKSDNFGLQYILDTIKCENEPQMISKYLNERMTKRNHNDDKVDLENLTSDCNKIELDKYFNTAYNSINHDSHKKSSRDFGVMVKFDCIEDYESKIRHLSKTLENIEKDYKKKINAVKMQYDSNIKNIINEHNQGVRSIQSLHEETFQDVMKIHENEIENLRSMSIEALRKVEKLEKENHNLKSKINDSTLFDFTEDEEPVKILEPETRKRKNRSRIDTKMLTKTDVEAFNVKPKTKSNGPCTCSVDMNISDTIRNIFDQVDVEQRKVAENAYLKYIANKMSNNNIEALDAQELSFLHIKVCRTWKSKLSKEETLQKRIASLENELMNKQRQTQQHMAELDRKVAEERRRLQEVRDAVCRNSPDESRDTSPEPLAPQIATPEKTICNCNQSIGGRRSAGDIGPGLPGVSKTKRTKVESNKAVLVKLDTSERRDKKFYDDPPIRLKRSHDRPSSRKK